MNLAFNSRELFFRPLICLLFCACFLIERAEGEDPSEAAALQQRFQTQTQPLLSQFCFRCHNVDEMESGIRVDRFDGALPESSLGLWKAISEQLSDSAMPPEDEPQPSARQREALIAWIDEALLFAKRRKTEKNGSARRLTVAQYQNTLRDLLLLKEDFTDALPPDAISADGFLNNEHSMEMSPILVESYLDVAERALDLCIVDEDEQPTIQTFRMNFGRGINKFPIPEKLILGPNNRLLRNEDFVVRHLTPTKAFEFTPVAMRTRYRFFEGYQGNATVRGWREYDSIYHNVYACMRGDRGYPKGEAYSVAPEGLLLRPAVPNLGHFGISTTYGPKANFKISLRELPRHGNLRVTVKAARYADGLLLDLETEPNAGRDEARISANVSASRECNVVIPEAGVYQFDVRYAPTEKSPLLRLTLGERVFSGYLKRSKTDDEIESGFLVVRLPAGPLRLTATTDGDEYPLKAITISRPNDEVREKFVVFEQRMPTLGAYLGLRRDCGSTQSPFASRQRVLGGELADYVFEDAITNHPRPQVQENNDNYLAGLTEIGIRSEYGDDRDMPRLLIHSVEVEGPYYETWPPATHRNIFIESENEEDHDAYAAEIIKDFATRAFRRPVSDEELTQLLAVWRSSYEATGDFRNSIKDSLTVVLTSPQFVFLLEDSETPEPEPISDHELASKLSYLFWNTAPDERLRTLALNEQVRDKLFDEIQRMIIYDERFDEFAEKFVSQWLSLDKFDVVEIDRKAFPKLIHVRRTELSREPIEFVKHLIRQDLSVSNLVESDFIVANEMVASYYGLGDQTEDGFSFVPVQHERSDLGGLLSQTSILSALSDGRESNPIKRGAWLARKIIAKPPAPPPPNVPDLEEDEDSELSLRERLERHRDQPGCRKCHSGIDPWGLPLEQYDAGGLFRHDTLVDARSTLPDETEIMDAKGLKRYLANDRIDLVVFSFLKHFATYAIGRTLTYNEIEYLKERQLELNPDEYRMQALIRLVVTSPIFLEK